LCSLCCAFAQKVVIRLSSAMCYQSLSRHKAAPVAIDQCFACMQGFCTWVVRWYLDTRVQFLEHSSPFVVDAGDKKCAFKPLEGVHRFLRSFLWHQCENRLAKESNACTNSFGSKCRQRLPAFSFCQTKLLCKLAGHPEKVVHASRF